MAKILIVDDDQGGLGIGCIRAELSDRLVGPIAVKFVGILGGRKV